MSTENDFANEIARLKDVIKEKECENFRLRKKLECCACSLKSPEPFGSEPLNDSLSNEDILRYSRQMILPEFRVAGQKSLKASSALVVGCGGLGCPAAIYLAAAGVGTLGLVDYDTVELSNLHRQVGHTQASIGVEKAQSLTSACSAINPSIRVVPHHMCLDSQNALDLVSSYDVVLDCTDNVATRYLLNDACLLAGKPLVSGSALRWEGQLTVYNYQTSGPTYRCLYPTPPPPSAVTNCSDGGVMGAVPGVIGCLEALEAIKILSGMTPSYSGSMLLFDGIEGRFRVVKLRPRREEETKLITHLVDYVQFCGAAATDKDTAQLSILDKVKDRINVKEMSSMIEGENLLIVDVRTEPEIEMCSLPGSINVPLTELLSGEKICMTKQWWKVLDQGKSKDIVVVCRRGNDSQVATGILRQMFPDIQFKDVVGGLHAWADKIDTNFPIY